MKQTIVGFENAIADFLEFRKKERLRVRSIVNRPELSTDLVAKYTIENWLSLEVDEYSMDSLPPGVLSAILAYTSSRASLCTKLSWASLWGHFVLKQLNGPYMEELDQELPASNIIFCDVFEASMDILKNHECYGLNITTDACCGLGQYNGWIMCVLENMACSIYHRKLIVTEANLHGMTAPQAAGDIHSDFEKGFIRAEMVAYADFVAAGSLQQERKDLYLW
ncbi:hypothetical protein FNV43_RR21599 [Rhamnella rubrinervis]|uniref:YchF C-terminal domain-containing protein n=1 Tax=Rhamnella rubrinervis TaxID=2594499 RepID=A0A8K0GQ96_9ROSA|nr:hypothetical protein FNV43_RR21599 [Rhamnella rubrinervis]